MWPRCLIALSLTAGVAAAELPMPGVADPVGLGPRLALIDVLRGEGATVPEGATLEQLKELYWSRHGGVPGAAKAEPDLGTVDEQALARDRVARLREELARRRIEAPTDADEDRLAALLRKARERERAAAMDASERAAAGEHGKAAAPEPDRAPSESPAAPSTAGAADAPKRTAAPAKPAADSAERPDAAKRRAYWREKLASAQADLDSIRLAPAQVLPDGTLSGGKWSEDDYFYDPWMKAVLNGPDDDAGDLIMAWRDGQHTIATAESRRIDMQILLDDPLSVGSPRGEHQAAADAAKRAIDQAIADWAKWLEARSTQLGLPLVECENSSMRALVAKTAAESYARYAASAQKEAEDSKDPKALERARQLMAACAEAAKRADAALLQRRTQAHALVPAP